MEIWIQSALSLGFTHSCALDIAALKPQPYVREMCAQDKCHAYGKNWTCPPHCGTLESCAEKMAGYSRGILVQYVGQTQKTIDSKAYRQTEETFLDLFYTLSHQIRRAYPNALCLGAGGCRVCKKCAWPEPCRFPEKACSSMEAYGLFVTEVCRDNHLAYHYGSGTITYTGCILF